MSLEKPKIPYVKTTAQDLLNCKIPIPKDAEIKMLSLVNNAKKLTKEYYSLNRKYNLKRIIRIQGTDHKKDVSKSSKLDIFGADTSQRNLETLGEKIAQNLVNFAYLWCFFCKKKEINGKVLKNYTTVENFKNDYFGVKCDLKNRMTNGRLSDLNRDVKFDKESAIFKMKFVESKICNVKLTEKYKDLIERFTDFKFNGVTSTSYVDFIDNLYIVINKISLDKHFAEVKNAVSLALEDAKNQLIRQGNTIASNIDTALHGFKGVALQYENLNQSINQTERCISELGPIAKRINERTIIKNFNKLCGDFKKVKEKFQTRDEELYDIKSFLKRFNIGKYDNMNDPAIETNTREFVIATKREAISFVKSIKKGSLSSSILEKFECLIQTSEKMGEHVFGYLNSKYYANYYYCTRGNTGESIPMDNSQLTVKDIYDWWCNQEKKVNPVCGYVIRISVDPNVNFIFSQKYSTIAKKLKRYCRKIDSNKTEIKNAKKSLKELENQIASIGSSSLEVSNETKSLVNTAVGTLSQITTSLLTLFN